eukprot:gene29732-36826_t
MSGYEDSKPEDLGGKVIGKRGVVITNLQRETKAKQINALQPVGNSLWIAVVILGGYKNIIAAYNSISEIVDDEVDGVVLEFMINYKKPFFLYGTKKFGIIKRLSAETNVRIFFPEFNVKEQNFSEALPVSLEGECVDVQRAVVELEKEAVSYRAAMTLKYGSSRAERDDRYEERDTTTRREAPVRTERPDREVTALAQSLKASARISTREPPRLIDTTKVSAHESLVPTPNSTKAQRIFELVNQKAEPAYEEEVVKPTRKFEKSIEVPSTLVGLLLSKKPRTKITTLNVIQSMTHTIISKIINPDTIPQEGQGHDDRGRRRRAVSDDENSDDSSAEDSAEPRHNTRRGKVAYVNDENIFVTFKVLGWTEDAVDLVIGHLQRIIDGDRIKEVVDDLKFAARALPNHKPYRAPVERFVKDESHPPPTARRAEKERAPRYTEVQDETRPPRNTSSRGAPRGLAVTAPEEEGPVRHHPRGEPREHREPRGDRHHDGERPPREPGFVKHTAEGAIFGGPAPFNRGGRGGGRGRADFAGGRGRDFGKDVAPEEPVVRTERREPREGGRGGRGRGGRGRGRGRGGDRDSRSPPRERTEGW